MSHEITLSLSRSVKTSVKPTQRVCQVAAMFGLGIDEQREIPIVPPFDLTLRAGEIIFITGASGGGKTTLLKLINEAVADLHEVHVIDFNAMQFDRNEPLIDLIGKDIKQGTRCLSLAGLNDAFVMLRKPAELSEGQYYRLKLGRAIEQVEQDCHKSQMIVVLADEFCATLDRITAKVIAHNIRKWISRMQKTGTDVSSGRGGEKEGLVEGVSVCFVAATTHDDLLESLAPDVLIVQEPGEAMGVYVGKEM